MTAYATATQLKAYLKDSPQVQAGDYDAVILPDILARASAQMDDATGRRFDVDAADVVKTLDGKGKRILGVPDLVSLTQVRVRDDMQDAWRIVTAGDVLLEPNDRPEGWPALWLAFATAPTGDESIFPQGPRTVELTAKFGFPSVPRSIEEATLELAVRIFRGRATGWSDVTGFATDAGDQIVITKEFTPLAYRTARRYSVGKAA